MKKIDFKNPKTVLKIVKFSLMIGGGVLEIAEVLVGDKIDSIEVREEAKDIVTEMTKEAIKDQMNDVVKEEVTKQMLETVKEMAKNK